MSKSRAKNVSQFAPYSTCSYAMNKQNGNGFKQMGEKGNVNSKKKTIGDNYYDAGSFSVLSGLVNIIKI